MFPLCNHHFNIILNQNCFTAPHNCLSSHKRPACDSSVSLFSCQLASPSLCPWVLQEGTGAPRNPQHQLFHLQGLEETRTDKLLDMIWCLCFSNQCRWQIQVVNRVFRYRMFSYHLTDGNILWAGETSNSVCIQNYLPVMLTHAPIRSPLLSMALMRDTCPLPWVTNLTPPNAWWSSSLTFDPWPPSLPRSRAVRA